MTLKTAALGSFHSEVPGKTKPQETPRPFLAEPMGQHNKPLSAALSQTPQRADRRRTHPRTLLNGAAHPNKSSHFLLREGELRREQQVCQLRGKAARPPHPHVSAFPCSLQDNSQIVSFSQGSTSDLFVPWLKGKGTHHSGQPSCNSQLQGSKMIFLPILWPKELDKCAE